MDGKKLEKKRIGWRIRRVAGTMYNVGGRVREGKNLPRSGMDRIPETPPRGGGLI